MTLLSMGQLMSNQFGFDRSGFRVFVLCAARRKDILLGKNLVFAPLALGLGMVVILLMQILYPMPLDYFLSSFPQLVTMYLLLCVLANWLSIFAPMHIAPGALRPTNTKLVPILFHLVFVFSFPLIMAPTLLPLGASLLLESLAWTWHVPICFILSVIECLIVLCIYRLVLNSQGDSLYTREQKILETVTAKAE